VAQEYPVELTPPDIARWRGGNTGLDYVWTFDSAKPGPHVLIAAIVHGNELCGAITVDFLLGEQVRPLHGKLSFAFCNVDAFRNFDPAAPGASRFVDEDFNRLWSPEVLDGPRRSVELRRARELRPLVDQVDFLLDIHSMQHLSSPLMMAGPLPKGRQFAGAVAVPATVVSDLGHAAGKRMRDYLEFADQGSPKNALLVECGQHWARASADVARETALRFLGHFRMADPAFLARHLPAREPPRQRFIEVTQAVTIRSDRFTFARDFKGLEVIPRQGTEIGRDGDQPVRTPYDECVLIMPSRRLSKGQTAVRLGRYIG